MTASPQPPKTPREELHALIELGYAAKDKRLREAAGVVDTWAGKLLKLASKEIEQNIPKVKNETTSRHV